MSGNVATTATATAQVAALSQVVSQLSQLVNVTKDLLVAPYMSQALQKAAGPSAEKRWLDTDHIFSTVDRGATAEEVIRWIEGKLPR